MNTLDDLRARYGRCSDHELRQLLAVEADGLTTEARQALGEEALRRGITAPLQSVPVVRPPTNAADVWHYPKAPLGRRFVALLVDGFFGILMPVMAGIIGVVRSRGSDGMTLINGLLLLASIVWAIYYNFTKDGHDNGRSYGKRAMGLMVVNIKTNTPCTVGESSLRALMLALMNAIPGVGGLIEPLVALVQEDGRRVGDMVAGTQVIDAKLYDPYSASLLPNGQGSELNV